MLPIVLKKTFFKLMNNSSFRRKSENLRKRINVRLVSNARDYEKYVGKPSFASQKISNKGFVDIHEIKPVLTLTQGLVFLS